MVEMVWDERFDFVVVGSGGGGLMAALAAGHAGHRTLVVESTDKFGGSTGMSGGILWVPDHPLQREAGVEDSRDAGRRYLDALTADDTTPLATERREAFLDAGPAMISFMIDRGIAIHRCDGWSDYHDELPGGNAAGRSVRTDIADLRMLGELAPRLRGNNFPLPIKWPDSQQLALLSRTWRAKLTVAKIGLRSVAARLRGAKLVTMGASLQVRLLDAVVRTGRVELRHDAPMTGLLMEGDRVAGVEITVAGRTRRIAAAHGVLLASGGFSRNQEMRDRHLPAPSSAAWSHTNEGDLGAPIELAVAAGAATSFADNAIWLVTSRLPEGVLLFHLHDIAKPHCIMVNAEGDRFTDESGSYMVNGQNMYARGATPGWVIIESRHRDRYTWGRALPGKTPPHWFDTGYMKRADSIEELAGICGILPERLQATVDRFNRFAEAGVDEDFRRGDRAYDRVFADPTQKPNPCLGAIERGPFYAVEVFPGDVGTVGGLVTDAKARVVRTDGGLIAGLYAAGNGTAPLFGRTYPGAGASIAATCVFGYVAARDAVSKGRTGLREG